MRVAIIGAGPSGLTTCKTLRAAGLSAVCFEAGERVGGQWVLDNSSGMSAAYRSLRTNTNKSMSRFSDFAFPVEYPEYPSHAQMAEWFESYARRFGVLDHVRFRSRVVRAEPHADGFSVETSDGERESFDALVVACGNLWDEVTPRFPGSFAGPAFHAKHYRDPNSPHALRDQTVLVVGLGNSGCEIAVELAEPRLGNRVLLSARSGQLILPRAAPGGPTPPHPSDPVPWFFRALPPFARDALFRALFPRILTRITGELRAPESVGLPAAPRDPFLKRSVVNDHVLDAIANGSIAARPNVRELHARAVEFADGKIEPVDAIIYATGYRFALPFLSPDLIGCTNPSDLRLYQGVAHPRHSRLFFVGIVRALCSIWPLSEQQARWVAALLCCEFELPSERERERRAMPVLRVPLQHCQFRALDLAREAARRGGRARRRVTRSRRARS
ncbi:MAG TPA: NAD(P)-binding domain-containing protein [Myxococcota bacterium]|nr:NAD(P)-binding domain-containing protein [Myxococcota bacterium]